MAWVIVVAAAFQMPLSVAAGEWWLAGFCGAVSLVAVWVFSGGVTAPEGGGWRGITGLLAAAVFPLVIGALVGRFMGAAFTDCAWLSFLVSTALGVIAAILRVAAEDHLPQ